MTKNLRRINPTEHQIQSGIVEWANTIRYGGAFGMQLGNFLIAIPNGGKRKITEAIRFKKEGVKKGVSDLFLAIPIVISLVDMKTFSSVEGFSKVSGLWLEVKTKNGKVTEEQSQWGDNMMLMGYRFEIVRSIDEGIQAIKDYLGMSHISEEDLRNAI